MKPNHLPLWLHSMQAVTWLVTRDVDLTLRALPKAEYSKKTFAPLTRNPVTETSLQEKLFAAAPTSSISTKERAAFFRDPSAWGGLSLNWLYLHQGSAQAVEHAITMLVLAAAAGKVAVRETTSRRQRIKPLYWIGKTLVEDSTDHRALIIAAITENLRRGSKPITPLFLRDDVLRIARHHDRDVDVARSRKDLELWMRSFAERFVAEKGRPPFRDKEATHQAALAGFTVRAARESYTQLPVHLKNAPRKLRST